MSVTATCPAYTGSARSFRQVGVGRFSEAISSVFRMMAPSWEVMGAV